MHIFAAHAHKRLFVSFRSKSDHAIRSSKLDHSGNISSKQC